MAWRLPARWSRFNNPWRYPDEWVVEMFAPEGPKLFRRGEWIYLVAAVGGTSGPQRSHGYGGPVALDQRPLAGLPSQPDCPYKERRRALVVTRHATVVQGPNDNWWMIYHGYENGFRTLAGKRCWSDRVDARRMVPRQGRHALEAHRQADSSSGRDVRLCAVR